MMATATALGTLVVEYDEFREAARRLLQTAERTLDSCVPVSIEITSRPMTAAGLSLRSRIRDLAIASEEMSLHLYGKTRLEREESTAPGGAIPL